MQRLRAWYSIGDGDVIEGQTFVLPTLDDVVASCAPFIKKITDMDGRVVYTPPKHDKKER
jgi:hypothetical protein